MGPESDSAARPRETFDEKTRAELLARYEVSGLSQREYARRVGIDYNTLGAWLWQQRRGVVATDRKVAGVATDRKPAGGATDRKPAGSGVSTAPLEVTLPGKIVVRGHDPSAIASLVQALKNQQQDKPSA